MEEAFFNEVGRIMAILASDVKTITFFKVGESWLPDPAQTKDLEEVSGSFSRLVSKIDDYNLKKENDHD